MTAQPEPPATAPLAPQPSSAPAATASDSGRWSKTIAYYIGFIALGLAGASLGPTLPGLAAHTGASLSQISLIFTGRSLGYFLGSLLSGRFYDRFTGHILMGGGLLGMAVLLALAPITSALLALTGVLLVLGVAEGVLDVGTNTMIVWTHREKVGPFMNGLHFFFGLGAFLAPLLVAQLTQVSGDITVAYWVLALLMLPTAGNLLRLPSPASLQSGSIRGGGQNVNRKLVGLILIFFFLYVGCEIGYGGWVYTYTSQSGFSGIDAALLNSAFWGMFTLGRLASIPIAVRFSPRAMLTVDLLGAMLCAGITVAWPGSSAAIWIGSLGMGLAFASIFPTMLSFAGNRMVMTGRINGLFFAASSAGGMIIPWVMGQLIEPSGPQVVVISILICLVLATAVFAAIDRAGRSA